MVVGIKDAAKLVGVSIIACCAVLVCTMFLNFYMDIVGIREKISSEQVMIFYEAQVSTAKVVCLVSGGCLLVTSIIMLLFYIKHYIDTHKKELGILKAMGCSNLKIAGNFWVFGISIFLGTLIGFCGAFLLMPLFYRVQNKDKILPEITVYFHWGLFLYLVIIPTAAFAVLAVCYACHKLKMPVLMLIKDNPNTFVKGKHSEKCQYKSGKSSDEPFIDELKKSTLKSKKTLAFFMLFASFCFSSMTQMSFSMKDLGSVMMGVMIMGIGIVLACTTLYLSVTTVINGNTKTIAIMRVFGYSQRECCRALLGGYRSVSYIGFAVGTIYQYGLLRLMVDIVFRDVEGIPVYEFDFPVMIVSLLLFIVIYETVMYVYSERIRKISVKEIMLE